MWVEGEGKSSWRGILVETKHQKDTIMNVAEIMSGVEAIVKSAVEQMTAEGSLSGKEQIAAMAGREIARVMLQESVREPAEATRGRGGHAPAAGVSRDMWRTGPGK